jgi:hypothetical protein
MIGDHFVVSYHTAGTLAANHAFTFTIPFDCTLEFISAVGSNTNNGILDIGYTGALEAYVKDKDIGDGGVPGTVDAPGEFVGSNYPHIAAGTVLVATLDYDGAGGTAAADFTLVMVFSEG